MTIRVAAIGFQHQHIFGMAGRFFDHPGVELVAVAEQDADLLALAVSRYPVTAYADYRDLLERERPDLAVLAPISRDKPEVIAACAAAGAHVFVDKPMATTLAGNERIADAIQRAGTLLGMSVMGGHGASVGWKQIVDEGALGKLVQFVCLLPHRLHLRPDAGWTRPAWSYERRDNGGVIVDLAVHGINAWRYLSGQEVAQVTAVHGNARFPEHPNLEDHASVFLTMVDGSTALIAPTWLTPDGDPSHGRDSTYLIGTQGQLEIVSPTTHDAVERGRRGPDVILTTRDRPPHRPDLAWDTFPHAEDDFLAAVEGKRPPALSAEFLVESQRIALLARDAAEQGRMIRCR